MKDEEELYEVEAIVDMRTLKNGQVQYRVRWANYSPSNDTWEPEENLESCKDFIESFLAARKLTTNANESPKKNISSALTSPTKVINFPVNASPKTNNSASSGDSSLNSTELEISTVNSTPRKRRTRASEVSKLMDCSIFKEIQQHNDISKDIYQRVKRKRIDYLDESTMSSSTSDETNKGDVQINANLPAPDASTLPPIHGSDCLPLTNIFEMSIPTSTILQPTNGDQRHSDIPEISNIENQLSQLDNLLKAVSSNKRSFDGPRRNDDGVDLIDLVIDSVIKRALYGHEAELDDDSSQEQPMDRIQLDQKSSEVTPVSNFNKQSACNCVEESDTKISLKINFFPTHASVIKQAESATTLQRLSVISDNVKETDSDKLDDSNVVDESNGIDNKTKNVEVRAVNDAVSNATSAEEAAAPSAFVPVHSSSRVLKPLFSGCWLPLTKSKVTPTEDRPAPTETKIVSLEPIVKAAPPQHLNSVRIVNRVEEKNNSPQLPSVESPPCPSTVELTNLESVSTSEREPSPKETVELSTGFHSRHVTPLRIEISKNTVNDDTLPSTSTSRYANNSTAMDRLGLILDKSLNLNDFFKSNMHQNQTDDRLKSHVPAQADLFEACKLGHFDLVRSALLSAKNAHYDLNAVDEQGRTVLMNLVLTKCDIWHIMDDIIELIIQHGANINARSKEGDTALMMAIHAEYLCKVSKLLSLGAAVNLPNLLGETPLIASCAKGFQLVTMKLLENGADFNAINSCGVPVSAMIFNKNITKIVHSHEKRVKQTFDQTLQSILDMDKLKIKIPLFPIHCYSLNESRTFRIIFSHQHLPMPFISSRDFNILVIALAKFGTQSIHVRLWGLSPTVSVQLNGVEQKYVQEDWRFIYTFRPLKNGQNELIIRCADDYKLSKCKLLIQAFIVQKR